jgi:hypothetical protein
MTNFTKNLMTAAAAVVVSAGLASAQGLKADVPFAFSVGGKVLPAGTYQISSVRASAPIFGLDGENGRAVAMAQAAHDPAAAWSADGKARLVFACGDSCVLREIWTGGISPAYRFSQPKGTDINSHIAVVVMRTDKGD